MVIDITADIGKISFAPSTVAEEIIQNVRTLLTTHKGNVPMDRAFGISADILDMPIGAAQAKLSAEIVGAVNQYEPRAHVQKILYEGSEQNGTLRVKVRIDINEH